MRCFVCWLFTWSQWAMQLHTWDFYNHCLAEVGFLYYNNILKGKHVNFAIAACLHWLGGHHGFPAIHCMWMHKKKEQVANLNEFMQIHGPLIFHLTPFGSLKSLKLYLEILPASHGKIWNSSPCGPHPAEEIFLLTSQFGALVGSTR